MAMIVFPKHKTYIYKDNIVSEQIDQFNWDQSQQSKNLISRYFAYLIK